MFNTAVKFCSERKGGEVGESGSGTTLPLLKLQEWSNLAPLLEYASQACHSVRFNI